MVKKIHLLTCFKKTERERKTKRLYLIMKLLSFQKFSIVHKLFPGRVRKSGKIFRDNLETGINIFGIGPYSYAWNQAFLIFLKKKERNRERQI